MKAVFLDRDGTLIVDPPDLRVDAVEKIKIFPETLRALSALAKLEYKVFIVSNQAGIAEGRMTLQQFFWINDRVLEMFEPTGLHVVKTYVCPHAAKDNCICRKPNPTLLLQAAEEFDLDLAHSWMIGDRQSDITAGRRAGTRTILVETGNAVVVSEDAEYTAPTLLEAITYIKDHATFDL